MHIAHLSTCLDYYGGEVCLANLAEGCAARGHRVSCLVRTGSELVERLAGRGVDTVPMPLVDWYDPQTTWRVRQWLRQHHVDIIATHLPRDYFIAATASWGLPVCNVATRHRLEPLKAAVFKRPFFRNFGAVVAVSAAVAAGVRRARLVPSDRVVVIPNGVARPPVPTIGPSLRERCGVSLTAPVVGLVGRLVSGKGADCLVAAVSQLSLKWPNLQVMLVGGYTRGDRFYHRLRRLAAQGHWAERLHVLGYVSGAAQYLREFDVLAVPSLAEPFGLVTVEAMACGVPVIATATGGSPEIMQDGIEGFLVPPGECGLLADRLDSLLGSERLRRQMGASGVARYEQDFTVARMVVRTETMYEAALMWSQQRQKGPA